MRYTPGGIEVLEWRDLPRPPAGEVVVTQTKIGLNFIDVYMTSGVYPFPEEGPQIPGGEAAGFVSAKGEGVTALISVIVLPTPHRTVPIGKSGSCLPTGWSDCLTMSVMRLPPLLC